MPMPVQGSPALAAFAGMLSAAPPEAEQFEKIIATLEGERTLEHAWLILRQARPELLAEGPAPRWRAAALVGLLALGTGGVLSWAASRAPDGLEWAVARVAGTELETAPDPLHRALARTQDAAPMPGYALPGRQAPSRGQTSLAGILGGLLTLALVALVAQALRLFRKRHARA